MRTPHTQIIIGYSFCCDFPQIMTKIDILYCTHTPEARGFTEIQYRTHIFVHLETKMEPIPCLPHRQNKMRIICKDVSAEVLYDVLHDTSYRKKWDSNMIDTYDIGRLTVNADVGYYSWRCPSPLKNRDFVTLRSWLPLGNDYMIINYSVKHPKHPPRKDFVRAVSLQTGYLVKTNGEKSCVLYYLTQVDPKGSLPKWVVNKVSQFVAPKAMKKIYKAGLKYPEWKRKHDPHYKPWVYPEQNTLPAVNLEELSIQRADELENIDESGVSEERMQHISDDEDGLSKDS
ncbi:START domain-containing protein 10-like isoform X1 [Hyla sarda]|uniref:START domain-containing protein 10-like isoform X1 n=2 Tax=Hyla sarda TaxID=327740 RepID=UPI0024C24E34|nr:START domain-containing protein 10-like isoform X1 [Hyla sarda]